MSGKYMEESIGNLYNKGTYLDKYGGSLIITAITVLVAFVICSYFMISHNFGQIRANWNEYKCHPSVIPFAGLINGENTTTQANLTECTQTMLTNLTSDMLKPIYYSTQVTGSMLSGLVDDLNNVRKMMSYLRDSVSNVVDSVMSRLLYALMPVRRDIIKMKSMLGKTEGVLTGTLFTSLASYMGLRAFFGAFIEIVVKGLIALAAFIIAMWIIPFTWPVAGVATAFFAAVGIPFAIAIAYLKSTIHTSSKMPGKPKRRCFDGETMIQTTRGEKRIADLLPDDELDLGNVVTGIVKCSAEDLAMYYLDGYIVSGDHQYMKEDGDCEYVANHNDAIIMPNYRGDHVYCLNTTRKGFAVGGTWFLDWDEVSDVELHYIKQQLSSATDFGRHLSFANLNRWMDGGFTGDTEIQMKSGEVKKINLVECGDILKNGEKVMGVVKVKRHEIYGYSVNGYVFKGGSNIMYIDNDKIKTTIGCGIYLNDIPEEKYLYHLLTDTDDFELGGVRFCDYNYCIDAFIKDQ
jgi:hypothetical protein